jgi:hypothetical protein
VNGDEGFSIGGVIAGALFTALGVLFMLQAFDVINVRFDVVLSLTVIALGLGLVGGGLLRPHHDEPPEGPPSP